MISMILYKIYYIREFDFFVFIIINYLDFEIYTKNDCYYYIKFRFANTPIRAYALVCNHHLFTKYIMTVAIQNVTADLISLHLMHYYLYQFQSVKNYSIFIFAFIDSERMLKFVMNTKY